MHSYSKQKVAGSSELRAALHEKPLQALNSYPAVVLPSFVARREEIGQASWGSGHST